MYTVVKFSTAIAMTVFIAPEASFLLQYPASTFP